MRVLIPASGLGTRLGDITSYTNKSLVKVGDKAAIAHIVDLYPGAEFVVTLGHFGDYVRQFLSLSFPERTFHFVEVSPYEGEGSSLLTSISFARDLLQCPFVLHVCDTLLTDRPPDPDRNWLACGNTSSPDLFRTVSVGGDRVLRINEKGEMEYDYAYIGVAGVRDYGAFWDSLEVRKGGGDLSDCHVFRDMLSSPGLHSWVVSPWYDIGSVETLNRARETYRKSYTVLDKAEEAIHFVGDGVVKFFSDRDTCQNRVARAALLEGLTPKVLGSTENFYRYELVRGSLLADVVSPDLIEYLVNWAERDLWHPVQEGQDEFSDRCLRFYRTKTLSRVESYLNASGEEDRPTRINGEDVPSCRDLLGSIRWDALCSSPPRRIHGDFILDNILKVGNGFTLLDWRQDFAGSTTAGDLYYDLAKLNHSLVFNHGVVSSGGFTLNMTGSDIECDLLRPNRLVLCQEALIRLLVSKGYDVGKVRLLTPIIWLNMSPLHTRPLGKFLFHFGRYSLWRELCTRA